MRRLVLVICWIAIGGCGPRPARLDTTNDLTARATFAAMTSGMSAASREQFLSDCDALVGSRLVEDESHGEHVEEALSAGPLRSLEGMTAGEISWKALALRRPVAAALLEAVPGAVAASTLIVVGLIMARRRHRRIKSA